MCYQITSYHKIVEINNLNHELQFRVIVPSANSIVYYNL